jgi:hypothetical protein
MSVSKTFYKVAGPLLYSNVIIKTGQPMSGVLVGRKLQAEDTDSRPIVNLKKQLLSYVQQITVATHVCKYTFATHVIPNLKTLLVIPYAACWHNDRICETRQCPILQGARPLKLVLHNSRLNTMSAGPGMPTSWPMAAHEDVSIRPAMRVTAPTLTVVLGETDSGIEELPYKADYRGVDWTKVKHIRVIIANTPAWLDKKCQRETCSESIVDMHTLASTILLPIMSWVPASMSIYLFRDIQQGQVGLEDLADRLDALFIRREPLVNMFRSKGRFNMPPDTKCRPEYTIKTLSDYIEEGLEDELLWQELKYWREENQRRKSEIGGDEEEEEEAEGKGQGEEEDEEKAGD